MKVAEQAKTRIPILMYHDVCEDEEQKRASSMTGPAYVITKARFAEQMKYLAGNGYKCISLAHLIGKVPDENSIVLTFDDGWKSNYLPAMPIMRKYGLSATVFVVSGFVNTEGYMSWKQLNEMYEAGFSIQSHTAGHRALNLLSDAEITDELGRSKAVLEDNLGVRVDFLSAPHGMIDKRVIRIANSLDYKGICTSEPGYKHHFGRPAIFHRINVSGKCELHSFMKILRGDPSVFIPLIVSKKLKNLTKSVLGYKTYRAIYDLRYRRQRQA